MNTLLMTIKKLPLYLMLAGSAALVACSGGSGQDTTPGVPPDIVAEQQGITYNGPAPTTDDVQNFKVNIWDNLAAENRCGSCHVVGGQGGDYPFVRNDDINLAYQATNDGLVDLTAPELSRLVTKVGEGHNCWRPDLQACTDTLTRFVSAWANDSGATVSEVVLTAPPERDVVDSKSFPIDSTLFASTLHPLLVENCAACHSEEGSPQQRPYFASGDVDVAYEGVKSKVNLDDITRSRLLERVRDEGHNCWVNQDNPNQDSCVYSSNEMEAAIERFADGIAITEINPDLVTSKALRLDLEGVIASSGGRFESDAIAIYQFKEGAGNQAFDTSGVEPALDLTMSGNYDWQGNWGISFEKGIGKASTSASQKLHRILRQTGEYSVEAWVVPANVTQEGPARIVTYSGSEDDVNFTLGQTLYNYDFLARAENLSATGMPALSTPDSDEVLQATLQHVVLNFNALSGRKIYVNGELIIEDDSAPGNLNDWNDSYALAVGSEIGGDEDLDWQGTVRFLAIHSRELTPEQVTANYDSGVGEKFFMLFGVSHLIDVPQAYIVFEAQQFDSFSYLFSSPYFLSLDRNATIPSEIDIEGIYLGVNGKPAEIGQAFANVDVQINAENYSSAGVPISRLGALVKLEKGASEDDFFLSFDRIGSNTYVREDVTAIPAPLAVDLPEQSDIGLRNFGEINATLEAFTTIDASTQSVAGVYSLVRQQLPVSENIEGFLAAHQAGIMQLSVAYCTALMSDTDARSAYFPGVDFSGAIASSDDLIDPLLAKLSAAAVDVEGTQTELATQPTVSAIKTHLNNLIGDMSSADTRTTAIAVCAATGGSAVMLLQ